MMESPFVEVNRIIRERSDTFDVLRIIADETSLKGEQREIIRTAADELEGAYKALIICHLALSEAQQQLTAKNDQLIAARKAALPMVPHYSMSGNLRVLLR